MEGADRGQETKKPLKGVVVPMRRSRWVLLILILVAGAYVVTRIGGEVSVYHGTVVDAETKAPLEGAVVLVIWYRKPIITMDGPQYFQNAVEVLTDGEGKFSVDAGPGVNWNPFTYVLKRPRILIFKPGYGRWRFQGADTWGRYEGPDRLRVARAQLEADGAVMEMPPLKTRGERRKFMGGGVQTPYKVPAAGVKQYEAALNQERTSLGLPRVGLGWPPPGYKK